MKILAKIFFVIMSIFVLIQIVTVTSSATTIVDNGVCGDNLTWEIDENGIFTLYGDGAMIDFESAFDVPWHHHLTSIKKIVFDGNLTSISAYAFSGCTASGDLIIPDSVTKIEAQAFYGCANLNGELHISSSCEYIGHYAFMNCYNLKGDLIIPNSVKTIEKQAFYWCSGFDGKIELSNNLLNIPEQAFVQCNGITGDLIIPNSVLSIGKNAFAYCEKLSGKLVLSENLRTIGENAFIGCKNLIGDLTIPEKVTSIGASAFADCSSLSGELKLLGTMTKIPQKAFFNCICLTGDLIIPDTVTEIEADAFNGCISFSGKIVLSNNLQTIGEAAFAGCKNLTGDLTIPDTIKTIGKEAFWGCVNLKGTLVIPVSVEKIEYGAFYNVNFNHLAYNGSESEWTAITIESYNTDINYVQYCHLNYDSNTEIIETIYKGNCQIEGHKTLLCSCGYLITENIGYGEHSYVSMNTIMPTCNINGTKTFTCSCGDTYTETIAKLGHKYSSIYTVDKKATCTSAGSKSKHCTRSGCTAKTSVTTIAKLAHTYDNACDKTCNVCSASRSTTHSYTTTTAKATLSKSGSIKTACTVCGNVKSDKTISYPKTFTLSSTSYTYNGYVKTPTVTVKDANGNVLTKGTDYTVTYAEGRKNVGTYKVTVKMTGNYTGTKTLTFKINPIDISTCTVKLSATSLTYNGNVRTPTVTVTNASGTKLTKGKSYTVTYAEGRKNVGTYKVTVKMIGNYTGTKTLTFKINPINISTCTVKLSATSLTYNGAVRTPTVTVTNSYGTKLTKDKHYTVTYAEGRKSVGTYKVTVKMIGNYTGTKTLTFKIKPIDISTCTVKLSATSLTYNGNVRTPTVTVTNSYGTKLTKDKHYTVTYAEGRKSVGTYKVTVKMIGNYTGTKTLTFKINPIKISTCTVKLSATSLTYNGNVRTPTVTVTNSYGTKLTKDKHYTVTYASGRKSVGTYKVTVKMIGNYTGTKTLTFKITPPSTTVASLKAGTKSITVNLTKKTTQVTGYQIQYSTNKDFTNAKTKTITSNSTVKTTLSSLTAGKTYYVRVRTYKTVNDVKYYSGWSAYKYVKTK